MTTDLEAKARAATRGPWRTASNGSIVPGDNRKGYIASAKLGPRGEKYIHSEPADLEYIAAASPDVVLGLIARVRALEAGLRHVLPFVEAAQDLATNSYLGPEGVIDLKQQLLSAYRDWTHDDECRLAELQVLATPPRES